MRREQSALAHGDLPQAVAYNPLLIVMLPFVAVGLFAMAFRLWTGRRLPLPRLPGWAIYTLLCVIVLFGVLRNVDVYPLTLLAPHCAVSPSTETCYNPGGDTGSLGGSRHAGA